MQPALLLNPAARTARRAVLTWLILLPLLALILAPMWHLAVYAFVPEESQFGWPFQWLPATPTFNNFAVLFGDPSVPAASWFFNSLLVTIVGTLMVLFVSSLGAYAFARLKFPGRDTIFFILLLGLMVPVAVTLIPSFIFLRDLKLLDTQWALWLPALVNAGGLFLLRQQFFAIPAELEDAARVDGAGTFRIYLQVCLPLVQSALVTQAMLSFLFFWNDLLWPLIVLSDRTKFTLTVGLLFLNYNSGLGVYFACGFLAATPALLFYVLFNRQIIEGVTTAGLAGR